MTSLLRKIHSKLDNYHDKMYSNWKILALFIPLFCEYIFSNTVHFADTVMVAYVSEDAVSGVSLAAKFSQILTTFTGGFTVAASIMMTQYIGRKDYEQAAKTAKQALLVCYAISIPISLLFIFFAPQILSLIYPEISAQSFEAASITLRMSGFNLFFWTFNICMSKVFISQGISKISLIMNIISNVVNIIGNSIFIYVFNMGVFGASLATLICTMVVAVSYIFFLRKKQNRINILKDFKEFIPQKEKIKRIVSLGIPTGFENALSYFAKFFVAVLAAQCAQTALNADTIAHEISNYFVMGGCAVGQTINVVIGHCAGAGRIEDVKYFAKKLTKWSMGFQLVFGTFIIIFLDPISAMYGLSPETTQLTKELVIPYIIFGIPFWTLSYTIPNAFRACGDVKYTMFIASISLWVCRVGCAYILFYLTNLGIWSLWVASYIDWAVRSVSNVIHFKANKWTKKKVI